jgi:HAD superfamily hydrolase (TIGR01549 family)
MIKAFIFDIDGTLIDSNDFHARAWERAFAASGKAVAFQDIRPHMGKGSDQLLPEFLRADEIERLGKTISELRGNIFKREYLPQVRPFPKVRELFRRIRETGARIALASSAKEEEVESYKKIAQIDDLVEKSTSSDDAKESKPEPDVFHAAMAQLGNPERDSVLVVGDTPYDAAAAVKAKLPVIGVLCGGFPEKALRANGYCAVYRDPADLLEHLEDILKYH